MKLEVWVCHQHFSLASDQGDPIILLLLASTYHTL